MTKKYLSLILIVLVRLGAKASDADAAEAAATNRIAESKPDLENTKAAKGLPMEVTLGAGGVVIPKTGEKSFGLDVYLSLQPTKRPIWIGIAQSFAWEPAFAGSTDLDAALATAVIKDKLYFNVGWSAGVVYDRSSHGWRSGPGASLNYYTSGNAFLSLSANYDLATWDKPGGWQVGATDSGLRYGFGIGIAF